MVDVVRPEPIQLDVAHRRRPVGRRLELQRILAEHVRTRRLQHGACDPLPLEPRQRLQRQIDGFARVFGLRKRADREFPRHGAAREPGASSVRQAGVDAQLCVEDRGESAAVQRIHQVQRRAARITTIDTDVADPEMSLHRPGRVDEQQPPLARTNGRRQ